MSVTGNPTGQCGLLLWPATVTVMLRSDPTRPGPHLALTKAKHRTLPFAWRVSWVWLVQDKHVPRLCVNWVRVWCSRLILGLRAKCGMIILW